MKVSPLCAICLSSNVVRLSSLTDLERDEAFRLAMDVLREFRAMWSDDAVPADLGTALALRVSEFSGIEDLKGPLKRAAMESVRDGIKTVASRHLAGVSEGYERFREAALLSAAANAVEVGVQDHPIDPSEAFQAVLRAASRGFAVDRTREAYSILERAEAVVLMSDNLGEFLVDSLLIDLLMGMGKEVTVLAKPGPILDDVTVEEALQVVPSGVRVIPATVRPRLGFRRGEATPEALKAIEEADLVIAKGMGHYETLTEPSEGLGRPTLLLLTAKCRPVARSLGVELGSPVALML